VVARNLIAFTHEGADHAHPCQVLLHDRVQAPERLLHLYEEGADAPHKARDQGDDNRHDRQRHERQPPVQRQEQDRAAGQHDRGRRQLDDAVAGELADLLDVVGQPRDQLAGLHAVVIAEAEPLDALEQGVAQVIGDAL
jgi:hypothetical protein